MEKVTHEPSLTSSLILTSAQAAENDPVIAHYIFCSLLEVALNAYEEDAPDEVNELRLEYVLAHPNADNKSQASLRISNGNRQADKNWVQNRVAISVPIELLKDESVTKALVLCRQQETVTRDSEELSSDEYRLDLKEMQSLYQSYDLGDIGWQEVFAELHELAVEDGVCAYSHLPPRIYSVITKS